MTQIEEIDAILAATDLPSILPALSIGQMAALAHAARALGEHAAAMINAPRFAGGAEHDLNPAGEWLEKVGYGLVEAADRLVVGLRARSPTSDDERETRALALIEYGVITSEDVSTLTALAASLAARKH